MLHRIYLSPGMFGFGRLASYDYFVHFRSALGDRIRAADDEVEIHVVQVEPTASIRRRALKLTEAVASTCGGADAGPIHLIGHSTGGLDGRLVASPSVSLGVPPEKLEWRPRLASVTTMNTPHFGTPLASFFATMSGERMLRAVSALTVVALSIGSRPLSVVGALVAMFGHVDRAVGLDLKLVDRTTEALVRTIDEVRGRDLREYLNAIDDDSGAMVQLMPEAMDLFIAGVEDRPGVVYQSTATMAPPPSPRTFLQSLGAPWSAVSGVLFDFLYEITSRYDKRYPCAAPDCGKENERTLIEAIGHAPDLHANDGAVPIRSQIWGALVWAGYGDHLDVLGHYGGDRSGGAAPSEGQPAHVDWLCSGSKFDGPRFAAMMDAITRGVLSSAGGRST
jgi:triacylglycerol lipase